MTPSSSTGLWPASAMAEFLGGVQALAADHARDPVYDCAQLSVCRDIGLVEQMNEEQIPIDDAVEYLREQGYYDYLHAQGPSVDSIPGEP